MFYEFRQNNSGGLWSGPALSVIVEADSYELANDKAENVGLYFNGCSSGRDCDCCGDRWHEQWSEHDASPVPSNYGKPIDENTKPSIWSDGELPSFKIFFKDGTTKEVK